MAGVGEVGVGTCTGVTGGEETGEVDTAMGEVKEKVVVVVVLVGVVVVKVDEAWTGE